MFAIKPATGWGCGSGDEGGGPRCVPAIGNNPCGPGTLETSMPGGGIKGPCGDPEAPGTSCTCPAWVCWPATGRYLPCQYGSYSSLCGAWEAAAGKPLDPRSHGWPWPCSLMLILPQKLFNGWSDASIATIAVAAKTARRCLLSLRSILGYQLNLKLINIRNSRLYYCCTRL